MQPTLPFTKFKCQMSLKPISTEIQALQIQCRRCCSCWFAGSQCNLLFWFKQPFLTLFGAEQLSQILHSPALVHGALVEQGNLKARKSQCKIQQNQHGEESRALSWNNNHYLSLRCVRILPLFDRTFPGKALTPIFGGCRNSGPRIWGLIHTLALWFSTLNKFTYR